MKYDSVRKYNPCGPILSVLIVYFPALWATTVYFLYPVFLSVSEVTVEISSAANDILIPTTSWTVSARLLNLSNDLTSNT